MAYNLSTIRAPKKANENKKRVGRGMGSGMGKTSTRGHKGQGSRSGSRQKRGFEGGQMPLLADLADLGEKEVTLEVLKKARLVKGKNALIKVLGDGELKSAITVHAHKFSKSAQEKIAKAGGKAEILQ
jgi:large subunit ribosomal protein L15